MQHFQSEMAELRARGATVKVDIGSREEVQQLKRSTQEMTSFCENIRQITKVGHDAVQSCLRASMSVGCLLSQGIYECSLSSLSGHL